MNRDNSPSQENHEELDTSRQILKAIFDGTESSIFLVAPDYRIKFFNKFARDESKLLYGGDLAVGDSILKYRRESDEVIFETFKSNFERAILTKRPVVSEHEMQYPEMQFWVRSQYTPVHDNTNTILIGVLLNAQNISDTKKLEIQNGQLHKQLIEIAWSQSHETRQPLATMLGLINILDKESLIPDNLKIIKLLEEAAEKLDEIIQKTVIQANKINRQ